MRDLRCIHVSLLSEFGHSIHLPSVQSTTATPQCVTVVRVEFRTSSMGPVVTNYTTTNTSQTEFIQTGLQCITYYYITVVVTGKPSGGQNPTVHSRQVQVLAGGKEIKKKRIVKKKKRKKKDSISMLV